MKNTSPSACTIFAMAAASCLCPFALFAADWLPTASGTYSWTELANWKNSTPPTDSTDANFGNVSSGMQTITGDGSAAVLDVNTKNVCAREFTGAITAKRAIFRTGTNCISGTLTLNQNDNYSRIGTSSTAEGKMHCVLDILYGGSVLAEGKHGFHVARNNIDNTQASGLVRLREGGRLMLNLSSVSTDSGLMLGKSSGSSTAPWFVASYLQEGGFAKIGKFVAGYEANACGTMTISGGILEMPWLSQTQFIVGRRGYGAFQQLGGEVYVNTNHTLSTLSNISDYAFRVGSGAASSTGMTNAYFYASSGTFVNGNAVVTSQTMRVGANMGDGQAVLNLNGGCLSTVYLRGLSGRPGVSEINADGGTVSIPATAADSDQFLDLTAINVYSGGLTVDCGRDVNFGTAAKPAVLRSPKGFGFVSIMRSGGLENCAYPPRIEISGGSGSNATAIALIDYNRNKLTNIVVTCRGEGYEEDDVPTVNIIRVNTTNPNITDKITVELSANALGSLVKTGTANLSLFAQPEFAGTYEVREGRMIQTTATTGAEKVSAIVVGGENAVFQCGSADATAISANNNSVNPTAALTLGTAYGSGTLALPGAASGEVLAFEQTFASLTVCGMGNAIVLAEGNNSTAGAKLKIGTINCPVGAQLTIPRWDSSLKVYVTGMPYRTVLRRVRFAGTDYYAAVAADGQLVPAPGFMMVVR